MWIMSTKLQINGSHAGEVEVGVLPINIGHTCVEPGPQEINQSAWVEVLD